jgi:hypothetical protein
MTFRKYLNPNQPTEMDVQADERHARRIKGTYLDLFADDIDPEQWTLPSGKTVKQAKASELRDVASALQGLAHLKEEQAKVDVKRLRDGVYQVTVGGRLAGEVRRYLGNLPSEIRSMAKGGDWYAVDVSGKAYYNIMTDKHGFKTRDEAVEELVKEFA